MRKFYEIARRVGNRVLDFLDRDLVRILHPRFIQGHPEYKRMKKAADKVARDTVEVYADYLRLRKDLERERIESAQVRGELKRTSEALWESTHPNTEEVYRSQVALMGADPAQCVFVSPDGRIADIGRDALAAISLPRKEVVGQRYHDWFVKEHRSPFDERALANESVLRFGNNIVGVCYERFGVGVPGTGSYGGFARVDFVGYNETLLERAMNVVRGLRGKMFDRGKLAKEGPGRED